MKVSILIPFYNDATVIEATARRLAAAVAELPYEAEILFVMTAVPTVAEKKLRRWGFPAVGC